MKFLPGRWRPSLITYAFSSIIFLTSFFPGFSQAALMDLRLLVITTGTPAEDAGLDLIDDILNEVGVKYDILDSKRQTLTADKLQSGDRAFYNGVILTNSELYIPDVGSGFTLEEWQLLHQFERMFSIRESVISGFPATNPSLDLDYGMTDIVGVSNVAAKWLAPAGQKEFFEYVNTTNPINIREFAFAAAPRLDSTAPQITPLLTIGGDTKKTLISILRYADGREVLLSTISNAWFLLYSQILGYEFFNFATKGVFVGARQVFLEAHIDDLFVASALWNPDTNQTSELTTYRMTGSDVSNTVTQQNQLRTRHPRAKSFKLDFAFNGHGATVSNTTQTVNALADTFLAPQSPRSNEGSKSTGKIDSEDGRRLLLQFPLPEQDSTLAGKAELILTTDLDDDEQEGSVLVCPLTAAWQERNVRSGANWNRRLGNLNWQQSGGDYDAANCLQFAVKNERQAKFNITPIVNLWLKDTLPNNGLIVIAEQGGIEITTRENRDGQKQPALTVTATQTTTDDLTPAIVANKSAFRFINHTYTHNDMDVSAPTHYEDARFEITQNRVVWDQLGLPERKLNDPVLITGNHSGLADDNGTELNAADDISYPQGKNNEFLQAAQDVGVRFVASDSSQPNQNVESFIPGFNIMLLPRWPTAVFYNVTNPDELTDEYNYIFRERHIEAGQDPCTIPSAICQPRNYAEILDAEADTALRHILTYRMWPHYFHQANLRNYNGAGATLMFDWLEAVTKRYDQHLKLPLMSLPYYEIGKRTRERFLARDVPVIATLDTIANKVTISAQRSATVWLTGIEGGQLYGGQRLRKLVIGPTAQTLTVNRALTE